MLLLLFDLDADRYGLDAREVIEVLPLARVTPIPQSPSGVAGTLNYRGAPVPVIDLTALLLGRPAPERLSTRLVLVHFPDARGKARVLGLIAEHATGTVRCADATLVASGVTLEGAPYLGRVVTDERGIIQVVEVSQLLTPAVRDVLFAPAVES